MVDGWGGIVSCVGNVCVKRRKVSVVGIADSKKKRNLKFNQKVKTLNI